MAAALRLRSSTFPAFGCAGRSFGRTLCARSGTQSAIERQIEFLRAHIFSPNGRRVPHGTSVRKLNDVIEVDFKNLIQRERPDLIVSCAMGNEYNGIAMLNHPRRFDFYLPRWPDLYTDESAEILPVDVVEDLLRSRFERKLALYLDMLSKHGGNNQKFTFLRRPWYATPRTSILPRCIWRNGKKIRRLTGVFPAELRS